jgi:hypothetical protein
MTQSGIESFCCNTVLDKCNKCFTYEGHESLNWCYTGPYCVHGISFSSYC